MCDYRPPTGKWKAEMTESDFVLYEERVGMLVELARVPKHEAIELFKGLLRERKRRLAHEAIAAMEAG